MATAPQPRAAGDPVVQLLWTGGWDSTFRLLELVLCEERTVQPHYVVDSGRRSHRRELQTMEEIRRAVAREHPGAEARILPTLIMRREEIRDDPEVARKLKRLRRKRHLGDQYGWLACYAVQQGLTGLEMAIENGVHTARRFEGRVVPARFGRGRSVLQLAEEHLADDISLFAPFRFPVLQLTKREMGEHAKAAGFASIMELTWFCHHPAGEGPCGACQPCRRAVRKGMGYRLPWKARLRGEIAAYRERFEQARAGGRARAGRLLRRLGLRS